MRGLVGFLLSAILGILSFPPLGLWPLAYAAMVPFLAAATRLKPRQAFGGGYVGGLVFFGGLLYWLGLNSGAPPALAWLSVTAVVLILATLWGLSAYAVSRTAHSAGLGRAALLFVTAYIFQEVFWGTGEMGFPWAIWALSQTNFLAAAQIVDVGDVWLLSLWVLSLNALIFLVWKRAAARRMTALATLGVFLLPVGYGLYRLQTLEPGKPVAVAAVQGNSSVDAKWNTGAEEILDVYLELTRSLHNTDVAIVVWPETAVPVPLRYRQWARDAVHHLVDSLPGVLVTGATDYASAHSGDMLPYNSAFFVRPRTRELLSSAKLHLVPFGERIPGQKLLPALGKIRLGQAEFMPGDSAVVFPRWETVPPLGSLICFEVVFPEIAADYVRRGAMLLANITEDGWYGNSSGPYQHLALSRLRAIAVRRSLIRAANTGISALIQPSGRIDVALEYNRRGVITGALPQNTEITLAVRLARIWLGFYAAALAVSVAFVIAMRRRGRAAPTWQ